MMAILSRAQCVNDIIAKPVTKVTVFRCNSSALSTPCLVRWQTAASASHCLHEMSVNVMLFLENNCWHDMWQVALLWPVLYWTSRIMSQNRCYMEQQNVNQTGGQFKIQFHDLYTAVLINKLQLDHSILCMLFAFDIFIWPLLWFYIFCGWWKDYLVGLH